MKWVKCIDKLPPDRKNYNGRLQGRPAIVHDWKLVEGYVTANGNLEPINLVEWLDESQDLVDFEKVTRLEVIGDTRELVKYGASKVQYSLQDDERTLKIFYVPGQF